MKVTGIKTLDHASQVAAEWLNLLQDDLDWADRAMAYALLRGTLHTIRDFLTVDEATDLAAQLPVLIRGIYYEGWVPARTPVHPRTLDDFTARVVAEFGANVPDDPDDAIAAVFDLLRRQISEGEFEHIAASLRKPLREMWM